LLPDRWQSLRQTGDAHTDIPAVTDVDAHSDVPGHMHAAAGPMLTRMVMDVRSSGTFPVMTFG
jgi:hypothetical protein